jgi:hypothetical protein
MGPTFAAAFSLPLSKNMYVYRNSGIEQGVQQQNIEFQLVRFLLYGPRNAATIVSGAPKVSADTFAAGFGLPIFIFYFHKHPGIERGVKQKHIDSRFVSGCVFMKWHL